MDIHAVSATPIARIDILHQGRVLKQIDVDPPATDIRRNEKITVPKSGWLAVRCLGLGENPNVSPAFAFAHTSPFYVIVDGQPIRSPEDARYFHDYFAAFVKRSLPRVKNDEIRRVLEADVPRRPGQVRGTSGDRPMATSTQAYRPTDFHHPSGGDANTHSRRKLVT